MTRFSVKSHDHGDYTLYSLIDSATGSRAGILPGFGANCIELVLSPGNNKQAVAVIDDLELIDALRERPSRYGIPILAPWPSDIDGSKFMFENQVYRMDDTDPPQPRYHGFVIRAGWQVAHVDCNDEEAWITCAISSKDCGAIADRYPSHFTLELTYRLSSSGLRIEMLTRNTGESNMPFGFGLHPYFKIPFGDRGEFDVCRLSATVDREWDIAKTTPVKAGGPAPDEPMLPAPTFPVADIHGIALEEKKLNQVYEARFKNGATAARLTDAENGLELTISASEDFVTWVFYTPPDRKVVSLEPWTLTPNGFNLAAAGVGNTGIITLTPGSAWQGHVEISLQTLKG